ncbi:MAG: Gfo/Idh/MocA family oxidoreductase [Proteobacteria bacterium]|jgi:predicted dehydrogenase|nr:Gfo/Idh/MocA family oxidoreductase [Pseudomonadota bacterium]MDA1298676.1 Gfo/Idh/MocA family oxidoreductase [Pseudomonadota bacterium]
MTQNDPHFYQGFPMNTPMDIRLGKTTADGIHFKLRWGIISASAIASDWIKSLQDVPGAEVTAVAARDMDRAEAYAKAHGVQTAYDSYEALCNDPNVDIVYIASKTWDHHRDLMTAINAGKHVLCEKPFTDTAEQAREVYAAAEKAGVFCAEGMWLRFFPAVEHARAAMERGDIGDLQVVQADYPDRVYALNPAITGFGADEMPVIAAAGRAVRGQSYAGNVPSAHGASPSAAILQYSGQKGIAVITFPSGRFIEETQYIGTKGRITIETPSHHPSALTIRTGRPPRAGTRKNEGKAIMELDPSQGWHGDWLETHWNQDRNPSNGPFNNVERFEYPLPTPAPITRGQPAGSRWTGERMIQYKGWTWSGGNQHGFMYQALAVHRCMAAGLKELPQFTIAESIRVCEIIDEINRQCAEIGF